MLKTKTCYVVDLNSQQIEEQLQDYDAISYVAALYETCEASVRCAIRRGYSLNQLDEMHEFGYDLP